MSARIPIVNCDHSGWGFQLISHLEHKQEVDLVRFDLNVHYNFCADTAKRFDMAIGYDPDERMLRFRHKS